MPSAPDTQPPHAAPAHLFRRGDANAPGDRLVVFTPLCLRVALHNAFSACRLDDVQLCVDRGASLEWRDEDQGQGMAPLHLVVSTDAPLDAKLPLVQWLLAQKVPVDVCDSTDCTPLHCAAALGDAALVTALLKAGAQPGAHDAEGLMPLHLAANCGHTAACAALVSHWAPLNAVDWDGDAGDDQSNTARVAAVGASLYIARRGTPLHVCCAAGRLACADVIIKAGADVNTKGGPHSSAPLHIAAREGHVAMAHALLDAGARCDEVDSRGETALMRAAEGGHESMVKALLSRGADAQAVNARGLSALHIAAAMGHRSLFAPLVAAGADVNAPDTAAYDDCDGKRTPIMYAAHYGCVEAFKELQRLGADARALSSAGWPPLFYAVENSAPMPGRRNERNRHLDVVRHILNQDVQDKVWCTVQHGRTALMVAAMQNAADAVRFLVDAQPWSLSWKDAHGRSATHWAAVRGATEALEALIGKGADVKAEDGDGKTPGQLLPPMDRAPVLRQWEAERLGAEGERRWDYNAVMEATTFRYIKKAAAARRVREGSTERKCNACERYSFDALRCGGCRAVHYCGSDCQRRDWTKGGHRLWCGGNKAAAVQPLTGGKEMLRRMEERPW